MSGVKNFHLKYEFVLLLSLYWSFNLKKVFWVETNTGIQSLRGLACLLVVYFHVVGSETTGLKLELDNGYRLIADFLIYLRMPLFTFLSGFVYYNYRFNGDFSKYFKGKARRILIPMFVVGSLFAMIQSLVSSSNGGLSGYEWYEIYFYPFAHFWFLQSIFTIFLIVAMIDWVSKRNDSVVLILALISVSVFLVSSSLPDFFSLNKTFYLFPFFLLGMISNARNLKQLSLLRLLPVFIIFISSLVVHILGVLDGSKEDRTGFLSLIIGLSGSITLLRLCFHINVLAYIGGFSYTIYLFHVFGTAAVRIILSKLGIDFLFIHVLLGVFAGVTFPIIVHFLFKNMRYFRTAMLGLR